MTDLHVAASIGFGVVGLLVVFVVKRFWDSEACIRERDRQIRGRFERDEQKRREAVVRLYALLDKAVLNCPHPSGGVTALRESQLLLESVYWEWLASETTYFNVSSEDKVFITCISTGTYKYDLPESMRKYKRK